MIADVAAFHEVSFEEQVDDKQLPLLQPRPMDQSMSIDCVGRLFDLIEVEFDTCSLRMGDDGAIGLHHTLLTAEFRLEVFTAIHPFGRHVWVQLERMPFNLKRMIWKVCERFVEVGFANVAPRADGIRNDIKLDHVRPPNLGGASGAEACCCSRAAAETPERKDAGFCNRRGG